MFSQETEKYGRRYILRNKCLQGIEFEIRKKKNRCLKIRGEGGSEGSKECTHCFKVYTNKSIQENMLYPVIP